MLYMYVSELFRLNFQPAGIKKSIGFCNVVVLKYSFFDKKEKQSLLITLNCIL